MLTAPPDPSPRLTEMDRTAPLSPKPGLAAAPAPEGLAGMLGRLRRIAPGIGAAVLVLALGAVLMWPALPAQAAAASAAGLAAALVAALVAPAPGPARLRARAAALYRLLAADPDSLVVTDRSGRVLAGPEGPDTPGIEARLDGWSADPRRVVAAALAEVGRSGRIERDFRRGEAALRVTAQAVSAGVGGEGLVLWRLARIGRPGRRGLEAFGLPVLTLAADGRPVAANPALLRLIDLPDGGAEGGGGPAPAAGRSAGGPAGPEPEALAAAVAPLLAQLGPVLSGTAAEAPVRMPGGQTAAVRAVPARDGLRDLLFLPGGGAGLAAADAGVRDYEDIPVALMQLDAEGRVRGTNRAARALLGLAPAEDRFLWEVVEGLGRPVADWLRDARAGRALNRPEVLRATCAAAETYVQIILRRPPEPAAPGTLLAVVSDATELKSLEARFVQSQKMQAIGQLAGGIAHDFNNLLTAISGHCDLLLMGRDAFDPDYADLQQIQQNTNRASALVRQLLAFSRKQTLQPEVLSVEGLLEDVVRLLKRLVGERIALRLRHDPALRPIRADRRQLEQVIVNLVVNARDAMPMGGEIRIETEALVLSADRQVGRARIPAGAWSVIRVIDTGVGIPPDLLEKIFEPFFTTKRPGEGTGLGLSTAYGIVKQMGGFIFADSREGSGSTFSLYFAADSGAGGPAEVACPAADPDDAAAPPAPAGAAPAVDKVADAGAPPAAAAGGPDLSGARRTDGRPARALGRAPAEPESERPATVLLVEDEAPVRAFAARALRMQGYVVLEAADGEAALDLLAGRRAPVDVIVTDVIMPGLDGPTWVTRALELQPGLPVIFVSGYIEDKLTEALSRIPNAEFLEKPFSLASLSRALSARLGAARALSGGS